jgi:hypothetical protein
MLVYELRLGQKIYSPGMSLIDSDQGRNKASFQVRFIAVIFS